MSREGYIYKLYCDDVDEFYIGSCWDMRWRIYGHKQNYTNPKTANHNLKVYQCIRENQGFDKWKFEILEKAEFENKTKRLIREQHYIDLLKPKLNDVSAYKSNEDKKLYRKTKINCPCGGITTVANKARHETRKQHQKYLNKNNNITINITKLIIIQK
jgi:hypothetical protein